MIFIETTLFTSLVSDYLSDDEYRKLQSFLIELPDAGDIISGTGGIRKVRWKAQGKGKRGGIRVIYYWQVTKSECYMLTLYAKNEATDLTAKEKKILKQLVERWSDDDKT